MKIADILSVIDGFAPFHLQEVYDNSGLQIGEPGREVQKGLICTDVTDEILNEAIEKGCDLIISHHPLLFEGLKHISGKSQVERVVSMAIKHDIAIISVHTNLDNVSQGVSWRLAEAMGLTELKILSPRKNSLRKLVVFCPQSHAESVRNAIFEAGAGLIGDYDCCSFNIQGTGTFRGGEGSNPFVGERGKIHEEPEIRIETILPDFLAGKVVNAMKSAHPYEEVAYDLYMLDNVFGLAGSGIIGRLKVPVAEKELLATIKDVLKIPCLRHSELLGTEVCRIAVCGGSGGFLIQEAMNLGAEVFVTADLGYHNFIKVQSRMLLIDAGHFETEQFAKQIIYDFLTKKISNFAVLISEKDKSPVKYF